VVAVHCGELYQGALRDAATGKVAERIQTQELSDDHAGGFALAQDPAGLCRAMCAACSAVGQWPSASTT